jgi:2'-hydroxyisoflavone reductase
MKVLVLGGTAFVGRHLVHAALLGGHEETVFNRGRQEAEMPAQVERLRGDRGGQLEALRGRRWDVAVDTCGYVPSIVRASATVLADCVEHYTFISSCSVYRDTSVPGVDENYAIATITNEQLREAERVKPEGSIIANAYGAMYGPLKALCEQAAEECMPGRVLTVRAGLIVGPFDYTGRFTYWPRRVAEGGDVLAPGRPGRQLQFIDARDLAKWIVQMAGARRAGLYNATGPDYVLTMGRLLEECRTVTGSDARFVWIDDRFLLEAGLAPWAEVPLWIPEEDEHNRFFLAMNCEKALAAGLILRPLAETIRDTLEWDRARAPTTARRAGLESLREKEVLDAWRLR